MTTLVLRPELGELPPRIKRLPIDPVRGYPIPWFVDVQNGVPEFRAADARKFKTAITEHRCWVCGDVLGHNRVFVLGPMCGLNKTTSEPPSHVECAEWSAKFCPFLSRPHMVRRDDGDIKDKVAAAGIPLTRNPGVTLLWWTSQYEVFRAHAGAPGYLIAIGDPERVKWYTEGREATRAEVIASIDSGMPALREAANLETLPWRLREAHEELDRRYLEVSKLFPAA